ncbi:nuclear transport factor 2 family protein [Halosolutus gelatinilyticus]|uniref:nuclear transport factor 2 family protein n=1 Tax=Halosolutus gelatinilyticus TaxID=2931975 RepID=UPI001FF65C29|nr:hypothetical protein [Halosolutus gelatinilyticus]
MMRPATAVRDYYAALREGEPLEPYFLDRGSTIKFGISEALYGPEVIATALREQTETTAEWTVESTNLAVDDRGAFATFADEVTMAWTDTISGERRRFDSRWSGTLVRRDATSGPLDVQEAAIDDERSTSEEGTDRGRPAWGFQSMHVSAPHEI